MSEDDQQDRELDWRRERSRYRDDLPLFRVRMDAMRHPASGDVLDRLVLESVDWVNLVAVAADGAVVMVRQFRFGTGYATLETPGGMVDPGEDSGAAARRELLEETGFGEGRWRYLGAVEPNPAVHDNLCHHWLAEDVVPVAEPQPSAGEHIRVELMRPEAVVDAVRSGVIRHALALSALSRVFDLWPLPFVQPGPLERRGGGR